MYCITPDVLDPEAITRLAMQESNGAVLTFLGVVRRQSMGRQVLYLEYEAYPEMAEKVMAQIGDEAKARWPIETVVVFHRTGHLEVGEVSLVIVVSSPHRQEAFEACQYVTYRVKAIVPVWKKEVWEGGEVWIEGDLHAGQEQRTAAP